MNTNEQSVDHYLEELRASGFHGREPWVAEIDRPLGAAIAILRQIEVCAEQMASVCLDADLNDMDNRATWEMIRASFLPRLVRLVNRLEASAVALIDHLDSSPEVCAPVALEYIRSLASQLHTDDVQKVDCARVVIPFLFEVYGLDAAVRRAIRPAGASDRNDESQLAPAFLERCRARLRRPLLSAGVQASPEEISGQAGALPTSR
jgi:hypothetical protein